LFPCNGTKLCETRKVWREDARPKPLKNGVNTALDMGDILLRDEVAVLEERELPRLPKDAPHVTWLRPREISKPQHVPTQSTYEYALGLPNERWSIRGARRSALVDSDWFVSGICCVAAAAPQALRQLFPDASMPEGGDDASGAEGGHSDGAARGDKAIGTCAPRGLVAVRFFRDGNWVTVQIDDRLPCSRAVELLAPQCESGELDGFGGGKLWLAVYMYVCMYIYI
jgi:hypothetical protein